MVLLSIINACGYFYYLLCNCYLNGNTYACIVSIGRCEYCIECATCFGCITYCSICFYEDPVACIILACCPSPCTVCIIAWKIKLFVYLIKEGCFLLCVNIFCIICVIRKNFHINCLCCLVVVIYKHYSYAISLSVNKICYFLTVYIELEFFIFDFRNAWVNETGNSVAFCSMVLLSIINACGYLYYLLCNCYSYSYISIFVVVVARNEYSMEGICSCIAYCGVICYKDPVALVILACCPLPFSVFRCWKLELFIYLVKEGCFLFCINITCCRFILIDRYRYVIKNCLVIAVFKNYLDTVCASSRDSICRSFRSIYIEQESSIYQLVNLRINKAGNCITCFTVVFLIDYSSDNIYGSFLNGYIYGNSIACIIVSIFTVGCKYRIEGIVFAFCCCISYCCYTCCRILPCPCTCCNTRKFGKLISIGLISKLSKILFRKLFSGFFNLHCYCYRCGSIQIIISCISIRNCILT